MMNKELQIQHRKQDLATMLKIEFELIKICRFETVA